MCNMINASIQYMVKGDHTQARLLLLNQQVGICFKHKRPHHKNMTIPSTLLTQARNIQLPRIMTQQVLIAKRVAFSLLIVL